MKKFVLLFIVLFFVVFSAFSDEYTLSNVPKDFIGTYIALDYVHFLDDFYYFDKYLSYKYTADYPNLILYEDICRYATTDGSAVKAKDFAEFGFIKNSTGYYIIDSHGNSYLRVDSEPGFNNIYSATYPCRESYSSHKER